MRWTQPGELITLPRPPSRLGRGTLPPQPPCPLALRFCAPQCKILAICPWLAAQLYKHFLTVHSYRTALAAFKNNCFIRYMKHLKVQSEYLPVMQFSKCGNYWRFLHPHSLLHVRISQRIYRYVTLDHVLGRL